MTVFSSDYEIILKIILLEQQPGNLLINSTIENRKLHNVLHRLEIATFSVDYDYRCEMLQKPASKNQKIVNQCVNQSQET